MKCSLLIALLFCTMVSAAPPTRPKPAPKPPVDELKILEDNFTVAADKADRAAKVARTQAAERRLEGYRTALRAATRVGDFDKATKIKARIVELEALGIGERSPRPKDVVKFNGHTYALIKEPATWHVAKRKCEEMGGHLVCCELPPEAGFISQQVCKNVVAWVGATDEEQEGLWLWVNGIGWGPPPNYNDNAGGVEHCLTWNGVDRWNDAPCGMRLPFVCEWDSN